ncbi:MAG: hypothetical protein ABIJ03_02070 [Patescibacteria group bacterium]
MQPHSACAIAFANYVWSGVEKLESSYNGRVELSFHDGRVKTLIYKLSDFQIKENGNTIVLNIARGSYCKVTVNRHGGEGSTVDLEHSEQHASGLREEYVQFKGKVTSGRHYNSLKYLGFAGEQMSKSDPKKMRIYSNIKAKNGYYQQLKLDISIE